MRGPEIDLLHRVYGGEEMASMKDMVLYQYIHFETSPTMNRSTLAAEFENENKKGLS